MSSKFENLFVPLTKTSWWKQALARYADAVSSDNFKSILILYNADVDGFAASYFVYKFINSCRKTNPNFELQSRAVWNYEYDFTWVPALLRKIDPDLVVCVDIPIVQEPQILNEVAENHKIVIYDHHIVPLGLEKLNGKIVFLNSRALGGATEDHPASAFTAAAAIERDCVHRPELLLLATGLRGDWALTRYPNVISTLENLYPKLIAGSQDWKTPLGAFTSNLNALFRAHPGQEFPGLQDQISNLLNDGRNKDPIATITNVFHLETAAKLVQDEVNSALNDFSRTATAKITNGILLDVLKTKTFNVGIIATILAKRHVASIIVLGFEAGERVQFELRVAQESDIDLTKILALQKEEFRPITSGGHPKAAGALVWKADTQLFSDSLRRAFKQLTNSGGICELHNHKNTQRNL